MLTEFFAINQNNIDVRESKYLYQDFSQMFIYEKLYRKWRKRKQGKVVGRIVIANPIEGEQCYLRLLLNRVRGPISYEKLRTVKGHLHNSYREAALAYGLPDDDDRNKNCLEEASIFQMPLSQRQLFATILV